MGTILTREESARGSDPGRLKAPYEAGAWLPAPLIAGAIAFGLAMLAQLLGQEPRAIFFGDSRHYLESCRQLVVLIRTACSGLAAGGGPPLSVGGSFADYLMADGPILPLMPAAYFALIGKLPTPLDWPVFAVLQSFLHGLGAMLLCVLMQKVTQSRKWALVAGLAWAAYPAAIVGSSRFLTETPTVLFLLAMVWFASRLGDNCDPARPWGRGRLARIAAGKGIVLGAWDGIILLFKPALMPAFVAVNALALGYPPGWRARALVVATVLCGGIAVILPWAFFSKAMTGSMYLTPQRAPVYNVATGCDIESDGWGTSPDPPLTALLADSPGVIPPVVASWQTHPAELLNLTLRKVYRLWGEPWNDFSASVLGVPAKVQAWWHILLWVLAVPGILATLAAAPLRLMPEERGRAADFICWASVLVILGHFAYVSVEANSRYGFTAMPFVVLLAVYGLFVAARLPAQRRASLSLIVAGAALAAASGSAVASGLAALTGDLRSGLLAQEATECLLLVGIGLMAVRYLDKLVPSSRRKMMGGLAVMAIAIGIFAVSLAYCLDGRQAREWSCTLSAGESACREIDLRGRALGAGQHASLAAVLIDGDAACRDAVINVNGHRLPEHPELLLRLRPAHYSLFNLMRMFATRFGKQVDEIRQWRVGLVPVSWLNMSGSNIFRVSPASGSSLTVYGDYVDSWAPRRRMPAFDYFSGGLFNSSPGAFDGRILNPVGLSNGSSVSWLESNGARGSNDLSPVRGRQTGQYRIFLMLAAGADHQVFPGGGGVPPASGPGKMPASPGAGRQKLRKNLTARDFDPVLSKTGVPGGELRISRAILRASSRSFCEVKVPPAALSSSYVRVTVSGFLRATSSPATVSVLPLVGGGGSFDDATVLPSTPPFLKAGAEWERFEISDVVPSGYLPAGIRSVYVALFPGPWEEVREYGCDRRCGDAVFKGLKLELEPLSRPVLDGGPLLIY